MQLKNQLKGEPFQEIKSASTTTALTDEFQGTSKKTLQNMENLFFVKLKG